MNGKEIFIEEQMAFLYPADFTKKEAVKVGNEFVAKVQESGATDRWQLMASVVKLKAVIDTIESGLRENLPQEKINIYGVEFTPVNGGSTFNFNEDPDLVDLKKKISGRKALIKLAHSSDQTIYDQNGVSVPLVSKTERKSSINLKF